MSKCLICTNSVKGSNNYHTKCLQELFGRDYLPTLNVTIEELNHLAKRSVLNRVTIPGVQTKLSLEIEKKTTEADKLTIVGLWGRFILKPPSSTWPELPENEHSTMLMAKSIDIETVPCGLIHLSSGERAYITKRIDRDSSGNKFAMEDMCQLTGRLTEDKYKGSHEQIAKIIKQFSANPIFDITRFFELVFFSYLTGNGDMHLKNFSLFNDPKQGWKLAPCYDLLSTRLVISKDDDPDELSLTIAGKKSSFTIETFRNFGITIGLNKKQIDNILDKFESHRNNFEEVIEKSFLSDELKIKYLEIITGRFNIFDG